jgi:exodeoxyribonuclease VII small subunit
MTGSEKTDQRAGQTVEQERFDEILARLRNVVEKLETGNLSLEDSLKFFEEGIGLCRRGATILDSAERKVEVLLASSGGSTSSGASGGSSAGDSGGMGGGVGSASPLTTTGAPRTAPFDAPSGDDD